MPGGRIPSSDTRARTITRVSAHVQFVVQIVFTTSSHTVGLRSIRPAPAVTQAIRSSFAATS